MQKHFNLFCFGLGYCAINLIPLLETDQWQLAGTVRTLEKQQTLNASLCTAYVFEEKPTPDMIAALQHATHILISIPPDKQHGCPAYRALKPYLNHLPALQWLGYLSTTGVYGDHAGGWVDENTEVHAQDDWAKARVMAEQQWLNSDIPAHVFRLSGIYGPNRNALQRLKNKTAKNTIKPNHVFCRIHVADITAILKASMLRPNPGSVYNCADDLPATASDVIEFAASLLAVQPPARILFEDADLSPMAQKFYASCKRVSNQKIKTELNIKLQYPTYKQGLKAEMSHDKRRINTANNS